MTSVQYRLAICRQCGEEKKLYRRLKICPTCRTREQRNLRITKSLQEIRIDYPVFNKRRRPKLPENWRLDAACRGMVGSYNIFYPDSEKDYKRTIPAREICAQCPVQQECLAYAIMANENNGIWGGWSSIEREPLRKIGPRWTMCKACERMVWRDNVWLETSCPNCPKRDARSL